MSYAEATIFAKNLLFSHSIVSKRSLVNSTGEVLAVSVSEVRADNKHVPVESLPRRHKNNV